MSLSSNIPRTRRKPVKAGISRCRTCTVQTFSNPLMFTIRKDNSVPQLRERGTLSSIFGYITNLIISIMRKLTNSQGLLLPEAALEAMLKRLKALIDPTKLEKGGLVHNLEGRGVLSDKLYVLDKVIKVKQAGRRHASRLPTTIPTKDYWTIKPFPVSGKNIEVEARYLLPAPETSYQGHAVLKKLGMFHNDLGVRRTVHQSKQRTSKSMSFNVTINVFMFKLLYDIYFLISLLTLTSPSI